MNTSTQRRVSGPTFSGSRLHWEWSLEYRWSFSSERTGPRSRSRREASSGKRWRWKEYFHFFWSRASWDYFYLARRSLDQRDTGGQDSWSGSVHGSRAIRASPRPGG